MLLPRLLMKSCVKGVLSGRRPTPVTLSQAHGYRFVKRKRTRGGGGGGGVEAVRRAVVINGGQRVGGGGGYRDGDGGGATKKGLLREVWS